MRLLLLLALLVLNMLACSVIAARSTGSKQQATKIKKQFQKPALRFLVRASLA